MTARPPIDWPARLSARDRIALVLWLAAALHTRPRWPDWIERGRERCGLPLARPDLRKVPA